MTSGLFDPYCACYPVCLCAQKQFDMVRAELRCPRCWAKAGPPRLDEETVGQARSTLEKMFQAFEEGRLADGAELHRNYHFSIWARAESEWLDHLVLILWGHTER